MKVLALAVISLISKPRPGHSFVGARSKCLQLTKMASSSVGSGVENPLLANEGLPKFESIEAKHVSPAMQSILAKLEKDFAELESGLNEEAKYEDVVPVMEQMQHPLGFAWGIAGHLNGVKNSDELRAAYEENQPAVVKLSTKFGQSKAVYDALAALSFPQDDTSFHQQQQRRAVSNSLRAMTLAGVALPPGSPQQKRFNDIKLRFAELRTAFSNNVLDATKAFQLVLTDPEQVHGVPETARAMWAASYNNHNDQKNATADAGPWRITLDGPSYIAAMQHIPDTNVRKQVYLGYLTRASEFTPSSNDESKEDTIGNNNVPIIREILKLRQEMADLLGYNNYAEMSLVSKMAPSVESVQQLSELILQKALPAAQKELAAATQLAQSKTQIDKLQPWDTSYWVERLKEQTFDLKEEELRPYFALDKVLDGMFGLVQRLFNIQVKSADGQAETWHPDVRFFTVHDADTDKHIASFYLDPYSRPENKRGGAWMDTCIGKSEVLNTIPVAYLTCNGSPPVGDKPSLMTFREVETLFHEFGHGLQHMLTQVSVGDVAGINGIEWDAVELPSQFMENWCYDEPTVYGFAKHYETGEPLPREMFEKLKQQKTFGAGMMACRQLLFGLMDIELHTHPNDDIFEVHRRIAKKCTPYSMPVEEDRFLCGFSHIFAGGYAAGYYSYKWAEVMSADAFGAFEEVGLENENEVKQVGKKFRDTVLSLGGAVEPMEVFKQFRGREPSPDALLRHNGLA